MNNGITKYYSIETNRRVKSALEQTLENAMLNQKDVWKDIPPPLYSIEPLPGILPPKTFRPIKRPQGQNPELVIDTYNDYNEEVNEEYLFDILYKNITIIPEKKIRKWYGKVREYIPEVVGIELVLETTEDTIKNFQEYLQKSNLRVKDVREVHKASLKFFTNKGEVEQMRCYRDIALNFFGTYKDLKYFIEIAKEAYNFARVTGYMAGPVKDVLEARRWLLKGGTKQEINTDELVFLR